MKAKFVNYYRKDGGRKVFVYEVSGFKNEQERADYIAAQGANIRYLDGDETKAPLFFATRPLSTSPRESVALTLTQNGRVVADDSDKVFSNEAKLEDYILREQAKLIAQRELGGGMQTAINSLDDMVSTRPVEAAEPTVISVAAEEEVPA